MMNYLLYCNNNSNDNTNNNKGKGDCYSYDTFFGVAHDG